MNVPAVSGEPPVHRHTDCGSRDRLWLAREPRSESTAAPHPFCIHCGTVKDLTLPRAKPLGYYLSGVAHLAEHLERSNLHAKLAQVHRHLMTSRLATRPEFEDPYGTPGQAQLETYVQVVHSVRPDLDEDMILRLLPWTKHRRSVFDSPDGSLSVAAAHPRH